MAVLGAGGGLLAVIDTVVLITGGADLIALALVALSPLLGPVRRPAAAQNNAWVERAGMGSDRNRRLSPLPVIVTLLFLRYENPLAH